MTFTLRDVVRDVASDYGMTVTDDEADHILWEYTGFPEFWPTGRPVDDCVNQVDQFFRYLKHGWTPCARCGRPASAGDWICEVCEREQKLE